MKTPFNTASKQQKLLRSPVKRVLLVTFGATLLAFNMNTFVHAGGLIPGGFTGLALLIQECVRNFWGKEVPFSVVLILFNAVPAVLSFKFIGKWYSALSCLMIVLCGVLTDFMPALFTEFLQLHDMLLSAVFGGLLNAVAVALCLFAGATSGGTDFIAIFISERYDKDAWNYIFVGNCVILVFAALLFSVDKALYSIIFQFTTTIALKALYHGYQQVTLFIITDKPDEVYQLIRDKTHHAATEFRGMGRYKMTEHIMLYSVVSAAESRSLLSEIKKIDPVAFVNVVKTERLNGKFYKPPKD
jgi:uncharacterized membrane-anchored protein YitT (DUF2179 family)